jgi:LPXTG-motif cell wall-anchored protein
VTYPVVISKVEIAGGPEIEGAVLKIVDRETGETVASWTSSKDEKKTVSLPEGKYTLIEVAEPDIYHQHAEDIDFEVDENGKVTVGGSEVTEVQMIDAKAGALEVVVTEKDTGDVVPDAVIEITTPDGDVITIKTDEDGKVVITNLEPGDYKVVIKEVPDGYKVVTGETDTVEVVVEDTVVHEAIIDKRTGDLEIIIVDEDTGDVVPGAEVEIVKPDGTIETYITDKDGTIVIKDTDIGDYTITVKDVPDGYTVTTEVTVKTTVVEDKKTTEIVKIDIEEDTSTEPDTETSTDLPSETTTQEPTVTTRTSTSDSTTQATTSQTSDKTKPKKTGDETPMALLIAIMSLAAGAAVVVVIKKRKINRR